MNQLLKTIILSIISFFILPLTVLKAQVVNNAWNDWKKIAANYESGSQSFSVQMKMYAHNNPTRIIDELKGECVLEKKKVYTRLGPLETIRNEKYILSVDHDDKTILITAAARQEKDGQGVMDIDGLVSLMQAEGSMVVKMQRGKESWLELKNMPVPGLQQLHIEFDPANFLIKRVWMALLENISSPSGMIIDTRYTAWQPEVPPRSLFAVERFVTFRGKQPELSPAYETYTLINQL